MKFKRSLKFVYKFSLLVRVMSSLPVVGFNTIYVGISVKTGLPSNTNFVIIVLVLKQVAAAGFGVDSPARFTALCATVNGSSNDIILPA